MERSQHSRPHAPSSPPLVERIIKPFEEFAAIEASGGVVLLGAMVVALVVANSPWAGSYAAFWQTQLGVSPESLGLARPLSFWINDGLMAIFLFVMGLEIKRQVIAGQLSSPRRAALPIVAALGGMLVPGLVYLSLNLGSGGARGFGIPMATDIAFTIGVMALLGARVPAGVRIFVVALAIADDIGAVIVIAVFYSHALAWNQLAAAGAILVLLALANRAGVRSPLIYGVLGIGLWIALLDSGVHTTIAGVLLAAAVPARTRINADEFLARSQALLASFASTARAADGPLGDADQLAALHSLEEACEKAATPLQRMEHRLHPWVTFAVLPLFALVNAGLSLTEIGGRAASPRVMLGVALGLVLGKPIGIMLASWLAVRFRLAVWPENTSWVQMLGASCLCGIGFTMALFIATLAFGTSEALAGAKLGILLASALAGLAGSALLAHNRSAERGDHD